MENLVGRLEFNGFEPSREIKTFVKEILEQVVGAAPSDASSRMSLTKMSSGFEGILRISSIAGTFFAQAVESDPRKTIDCLKETVIAQIERWRHIRLVPAD